LTICKRCLVSGVVQGVFYRASTRFEAERLNITGYAKNLSDGRVEVLACGDRDNVEQLVEWLRKGPAGARVSGVSSEATAKQELLDFTIG